MTNKVRSQEKLLTAPQGRAGFHRWWGWWCESHLNLQTKRGECWRPAGHSGHQGHQQPILCHCPKPISAYDEAAEMSLHSTEECSPSLGQHIVHMGAAWEIAEKPVMPSHCSNSLPDYLGVQVCFVSLSSLISYSFLPYLFAAYLSISNLADIHTNVYVYTSLWSRSDLYIYRSDLVLAIAQLWEIGLDLQKFLPANISVTFTLSYVHHYTQFSSCRYHFAQYFLAESPAAYTEMQLIFFMWTIQLSYSRCLFITNQVKWRRQNWIYLQYIETFIFYCGIWLLLSF